MSGLQQTELAASDLILRQHGQESLDAVLRSPLFVKGVEKTFPLFGREGTYSSTRLLMVSNTVAMSSISPDLIVLLALLCHDAILTFLCVTNN